MAGGSHVGVPEEITKKRRLIPLHNALQPSVDVRTVGSRFTCHISHNLILTIADILGHPDNIIIGISMIAVPGLTYA